MGNIWTVAPYVYKATTSGLEVYDYTSEALINYAYPAGANAVWANSQYIYIATTNSGVARCPVNSVSGTMVFSTYKQYPDITANEVLYIHGGGDYLCASTVSGVDRYKVSTDTRISTTVSGVSKCFQTSVGDYYFVVNPVIDIIGLDDSVFSWEYCSVITLSSGVPYDNYNMLFEIPLTAPDIYAHSSENGEDIRILDDTGNLVPFYIESWDGFTPPQFWTKLQAGTEKLYLLYGNPMIPVSASDGESTFLIYDDFEGDTLDSTKWTFNSNNTDSYHVTVHDGVADFRCQHYNAWLYMYSNQSFQTSTGLALDYAVKYTSPSTYETSMLWRVGFHSGAAYTGPYSEVRLSSNPAHTLFSNTSEGDVVGTKYLAKDDFKNHSIIESSNYQESTYDSETLTTSGSLTLDSHQIRFYNESNAGQPDVYVDWIRVRSYDPNLPTYTVAAGAATGTVFDLTKLYARYNSGSGYTYVSGQDAIISVSYIHDLHVTEDTSINGGNVLFLATTWGATVIEEKRSDESNCDKRIYLIET